MKEGEVAQITVAIERIEQSLVDFAQAEEKRRATAQSIVIGNVFLIRKRIATIRVMPRLQKQRELGLLLKFAEEPPKDGCLMSPGIEPILRLFASGTITLMQVEELLTELHKEYTQLYKERGYFNMNESVANG